MGNYNETDFNNALEVLSKCRNYVADQVKDIYQNTDFEDIRLLHLGNTGYPSSRGGCDYYLCAVNRYDILVAKGKCVFDGWVCCEEVACKNKNMKYAYNSTPQSTIDLAVKVANNWETIKARLQSAIVEYHKRAKANSDVLSNFQI